MRPCSGQARRQALGWLERDDVADEPGQDPNGDRPLERDVRLSSLDARLKAAADAGGARSGGARPTPKGQAQGSRVLSELVAGPAGGALVGWLIDRWFNTSPWGLLVLLFLGIAVAMRNIYRISQQRPE